MKNSEHTINQLKSITSLIGDIARLNARPSAVNPSQYKQILIKCIEDVNNTDAQECMNKGKANHVGVARLRWLPFLIAQYVMPNVVTEYNDFFKWELNQNNQIILKQ